MTLIVVRGGQTVSEEELRAHLAAVLRLENIGVLLGAGASCSAGGKTVHQLWSDFITNHKQSSEWLVKQDFIAKEKLNDALAATDIPNIEELGDALEVAALEWERAKRPESDKKAIATVRADLQRSVITGAILKSTWWKDGATTESDPALGPHRALLQKLTGARQPGQPSPWVFTTNYDLAVEWAAESIDLQVINGFLGLHNRKFSPQSFDLGFRNTLARGEARFGTYNIYLAKLHGSLTWKRAEEVLQEWPAAQAWGRLEKFMAGEGTEPGFLVYPRAAKYIQTVGFILGELIRRFSEFLARPQTALVTNGYSFADEHLNRLLLSALQNPTLQLVIYLPEFSGSSKVDGLPLAIRKLIEYRSPRITLVGGGDEAFFEKLVEHLPDPMLFDEDAQKVRELIQARKVGLDPKATLG